MEYLIIGAHYVRLQPQTVNYNMQRIRLYEVPNMS